MSQPPSSNAHLIRWRARSALVALLALCTPLACREGDAGDVPRTLSALSGLAASVGPEQGTDDPLPVPVGQLEGNSASARGAGASLVVWQDARVDSSTVTYHIFGARIDASGKSMDTSGIAIALDVGAQSNPAVAFDGTNWLVVWQDTRNSSSGSDIYAARVNAAGVVLDPGGFPVATGGSRISPAVAFDGARFVVAHGVGPEVHVDFVRTTGVVDATATVLATAPNPIAHVSAASGGTQTLVVYDYKVAGTTFRVGGRRVATDGTLPDAAEIPVCAGTTACGNSVLGIASDGSGWLVAFDSYGSGVSVNAQRVAASGSTLDGTGGFPVGPSTGTEFPAGISVAFAAGNGYGVFWDDQTVLYGARINSAGSFLVSRTTIVTLPAPVFQLAPAAVHDGTNFLLTYMQQTYDLTSLRVDNNFVRVDAQPGDVAVPANAQTDARFAWNGSNWLGVWLDQRGTTTRITAVRFDASGAVRDHAGIAIGDSTTYKGGPNVAAVGSDWLVVWRDSIDPGSGGAVLKAVRVAADGTLRDASPFTVGPTAQEAAQTPAVSGDGGQWFVFWPNLSGEVRGCRVSAQGVPLDGAGILIASDAASGGTIAAAWNGAHHLVAWNSNTSSGDIRAARVTSAATVVDAAGAAISVASQPVAETSPAIATNGDGWLVAWRDANGVHGARVTANGNLQDPNGLAVGGGGAAESLPTVAWDGGQYWVAWQDARRGTGLIDLLGGRVTPSGTVEDAAPVALAADRVLAQLSPRLAGGPAGKVLLGYSRFVLEQPLGTIRVRTRMLADTAPSDGGTAGDASSADGAGGGAGGSGGSDAGASDAAGSGSLDSGAGGAGGRDSGAGGAGGAGTGDAASPGRGGAGGASDAGGDGVGHASSSSGCGCDVGGAPRVPALFLLAFSLIALRGRSRRR